MGWGGLWFLLLFCCSCEVPLFLMLFSVISDVISDATLTFFVPFVSSLCCLFVVVVFSPYSFCALVFSIGSFLVSLVYSCFFLACFVFFPSVSLFLFTCVSTSCCFFALFGSCVSPSSVESNASVV